MQGAARSQQAACTRNFLIQEWIGDWSGFHGELLGTPLTFEDGMVIPPTERGLGVGLDEEVARAHKGTTPQTPPLRLLAQLARTLGGPGVGGTWSARR